MRSATAERRAACASGIGLAQKIALRRHAPATAPCGGRLRRVRRNRGMERRGRQRGAVANALQQVGLGGLQRDQAAEHVQHVEQFGCVLRQPAGRLDLAERRGLAAVADEGTLIASGLVVETSTLGGRGARRQRRRIGVVRASR